ncbi:MAG: hypothetical protein AAGD04_10190 [Pseudomonadota bacterium]
MGIRAVLVGAFALCFVLGCAPAPKDLPPSDPRLENIQIIHTLVVAENARKGPLSREAKSEDWTEVFEAALQRQFSRYQGPQIYHIGIGIDGYVLAQPGIPIAFSPKSTLVFTANLWDNRTQDVVNSEPKRFVVFEGVSGETLIGSGLTRTKVEQMDALVRNAARDVEAWIADNPDFTAP